jgi:hypothetical protein
MQRNDGLDSVSALSQQAAIDRELHIQMGDCADLIEAKLRESEAFVDARLDALAARIERLEAERGR